MLWRRNHAAPQRVRTQYCTAVPMCRTVFWLGGLGLGFWMVLGVWRTRVCAWMWAGAGWRRRRVVWKGWVVGSCWDEGDSNRQCEHAADADDRRPRSEPGDRERLRPAGSGGIEAGRPHSRDYMCGFCIGAERRVTMMSRILLGGMPVLSAVSSMTARRGGALSSSRVAAAAWVSAMPARTVSSPQ